MRGATLAGCAALVLAGAGCGGPGPAGASCADDGDCDDELACLERVCAARFDDPGGDPEPRGGAVRVLSVGMQPRLEDVESQESFGAAVRELVLEQVVPHLASDRPNLVVFPENAGFHAALIGERGEEARQAGDSTLAFASLFGSYSDAVGVYSRRADRELSSGRLVTLAITDTLWRSIEGAFAELADELDVYIATSYVVADAEQTTEPELVAALVDESVESPDAAWIAIGDRVYNQTLVFDPSGELVLRHRKEYLVPLEETELDLSYGAPGNLEGRELGFGPIASAISKDAWMPDVLDRLALSGTAMVLQPEAFAGWGVPHAEDEAWAPDVVKESGWGHIHRYPELAVNVMPCLSGNLYELVFDCQSSILTDRRFGEARGAFIGQDDDVGFARVAPWVVADEGEGDLDERRAALIEVGERLLPGSGDELENAYAAETVWMDLDLSTPWPEGDPGESAEVAAASAGQQRRPDVAVLEDGAIVAVWEDTRAGPARLYGARGERRDDGTIEFAEARVRAAPGGAVRAPRLAAEGDRLHVVWQEMTSEGWRVFYARSSDGGRSLSAPHALSGGDGAQWIPDVAVSGDAVYVAWADAREGPVRIYAARSTDGGNAFEPAVPVEPPAEGGYDPRENRWAPSVAARGDDVARAWADFRTYAWTIRGAVSADRGASFSASASIDDADVPYETIHSEPQSLLPGDGSWLVVWTDLRERRPAYHVRARRLPLSDLDRADDSVVLAPSGERPQWRPAIAASGSEVVALWQDFRTDRNRIRLARSDDGGASFGVDELPPGAAPADAPVSEFAPRIAPHPDGGFIAVFESTAGGSRRIRAVSVPRD